MRCKVDVFVVLEEFIVVVGVLGSRGDLKTPPSNTTKKGFAHGIVARMMLTCMLT